jgi:hypothetical protein
VIKYYYYKLHEFIKIYLRSLSLNVPLVIAIVIFTFILIGAALIAPLTIYFENQQNTDNLNTQISLQPLITTTFPITITNMPSLSTTNMTELSQVKTISIYEKFFN